MNYKTRASEIFPSREAASLFLLLSFFLSISESFIKCDPDPNHTSRYKQQGEINSYTHDRTF